jgi:hypothetical protein
MLPAGEAQAARIRPMAMATMSTMGGRRMDDSLYAKGKGAS